jgi:hypothetical protein
LIVYELILKNYNYCVLVYLVKTDALPFMQRQRHCISIRRLHSNNLHFWSKTFHIGRNASYQAASPHWDEDGVNGPWVLPQDLHANSSLETESTRQSRKDTGRVTIFRANIFDAALLEDLLFLLKAFT